MRSEALASATLTTLAEQPPPRRGAKEGFYPDPLGSGRARWWDGTEWTMRVGPLVPADAPAGKPVEAPAKRCRHCGAESKTFDDKCPNCGRSYGTSPGVVAAIVAGGIVACLLLLGGCGLLIKAAVDKASDEIDKRAITQAEFESVKPGESEDSVRRRLGDPTSEKTFGNPSRTCIQYPQKGDGLLGLDEYRLCFVGGVLVFKRAE